jgi:hypothetical protein
MVRFSLTKSIGPRGLMTGAESLSSMPWSIKEYQSNGEFTQPRFSCPTAIIRGVWS